MPTGDADGARRLDRLAWPALLGRWMDLARASVALPGDEAGRAWRASIEPLVSLQAVAFALGDLECIDPLDRPYARDRASVLVREAAGALDAAWRGETMPEGLLEAAADARAALAAAPFAAPVVFAVAADGAPLVMPAAAGAAALASARCDPRGSLLVVPPGTPLMPGAPAAWWCEREDDAALVDALRAAGFVRADADAFPAGPQVYRELDDAGRFVRDVVAAIAGDLRPGLPLLMPVLDEGRVIASAFPEDETVRRDRHAAALAGRTRIPLVDAAAAAGDEVG